MTRDKPYRDPSLPKKDEPVPVTSAVWGCECGVRNFNHYVHCRACGEKREP